MGPSGTAKFETLLAHHGRRDTPSGGGPSSRGKTVNRSRIASGRCSASIALASSSGIQTLLHTHGCRGECWPAVAPRGTRGECARRAGECIDKGQHVAIAGSTSRDEMVRWRAGRVRRGPALIRPTPKACLCDEPTGNLDTATSRENPHTVRQVARTGKRGATFCDGQHDPSWWRPNGTGW